MQTLHCNNCSSWLRIKFKPFDEVIEGIKIIIPDMPILVCPDCDTEYKTDFEINILIYSIQELKKHGKKIFNRPLEIMSHHRYPICEKYDFKYDANDCRWIPGLANGFAKVGFFTPIFFNRKVLHKYLSFDEYRIDITGNTSGRIFFDNGDSLDYGINRNDKMFCWLGDIEENIPEKEIQYLLSENVESDHDIGSDFYANQIEAEFTDYSDEAKLFNIRSKFDTCWNENYRSKIFQDDENMHTILEDLKRPVNWNKQGVLHVFNFMNKICNEAMCKDAIIDVIKKKKCDFNDEKMGSIKLLEKLIEIKDPKRNAKEIMKFFFILNDFRNMLNHYDNEENKKKKLDYCYERLKIPNDYTNFEKLYEQLMKGLTNSYSKIITVLLSDNHSH